MKKITLNWLNNKDACQPGADWWDEQDLKSIDLFDLINLLQKDGHLDWIIWLITNNLNKKKNVMLAIYAAELVLPIFEKKYPEDKRPREAIEAAKAYVKSPTSENEKKARKAANAAAAAANSAAHAVDDTANSAVYADAARAAAAAARAADADATADADAAAAADADAAAAAAANVSKKETYQKIIDYGIKLLKG